VLSGGANLGAAQAGMLAALDEAGVRPDLVVGTYTAVLDEEDLTRQHSALMSPLVWDLAHVGNYEDATGDRPALRRVRASPRRTAQPALLSTKESSDYVGLVRRKVLDSLETVRLDPSNPLLETRFVCGLVLQHEHQHDETMLATHQLRRGAASRFRVPRAEAGRRPPCSAGCDEDVADVGVGAVARIEALTTRE